MNDTLDNNFSIEIDPIPAAPVVSPSTREQINQMVDECCTMLDWYADSDDGFPFLADGDMFRAPALFK